MKVNIAYPIIILNREKERLLVTLSDAILDNRDTTKQTLMAWIKDLEDAIKKLTGRT